MVIFNLHWNVVGSTLTRPLYTCMVYCKTMVWLIVIYPSVGCGSRLLIICQYAELVQKYLCSCTWLWCQVLIVSPKQPVTQSVHRLLPKGEPQWQICFYADSYIDVPHIPFSVWLPWVFSVLKIHYKTPWVSSLVRERKATEWGLEGQNQNGCVARMVHNNIIVQ